VLDRTIHRTRGLAALIAIALIAVGCGSDGAGDSPPPTRTLVPPTATIAPTAAPQASPTPTATNLPAAAQIGATPTPIRVIELPPAVDDLVMAAMADLADRQGVERASIRLLSVEGFTWPDAGLGCAAPGSQDAGPSVRTPGYRILLSVEGRVYVYHTDAEARVLPCDDPGWLAREGEPLPIDPVARSVADVALADAAQRFGIPAARVDLVSLLAVEWPDTSLGCPRPNATYAEQATPGYRIVLRAGVERAIYHTNSRDVMPCPADQEVLPDWLQAALPTPDATAESDQ